MSSETENLVASTIENAQEVCDPLDELVGDASRDPGIAFEPEALKCLATLKRENLAKFETLRMRLKQVGVRVTALDKAIADESGESGGRGPTQADILIQIADSTQLFHTPGSIGYADLEISGHRET